MNVLFIGRFQPFHLGHLQVVKDSLSDFSFIYIGVGSSQYHHTMQNPFTYKERKIMIQKALAAERISSFEIVSIPDIHNPPKWVDHVCGIVDDFSDVITNNDLTKSLFEQKGFRVHQTELYKKKLFSGKEIRTRMKHHQPWGHLVHPAVYEYLCSIDAEDRMQSIS